MSNNRSSNRRRGRGGNRPQGGGNQLNRIDSRARGNAPQLLEKYKKLAHDAAMNGDRVQSEYYLQFADHYFRVMADSRVQRDDQPQRPRREFDPQSSSDDDDFYGDDDRQDRQERAPQQQERDRDGRAERDEGERGQESSESAAEGDNPFIRREQHEPREPREPRREPRGERQPRGNGRGNGGNEPRAEEASAGLDPSILPPAIGIDAGEDVADKPKRARRSRSRPADEGEGDETLEAVG